MKKNTLDSVLRSTWNSVSKMYNREASKFDSTMATGFALLNIDAEGTPSSALGPKLGMESTSLSRTLKSMEELKLIKRVSNPEDRRGVLIKLTEKGIDLRNLAKKNGVKFNKVVYEKIGKEDINIFLSVMNKINKMIKKKKIY